MSTQLVVWSRAHAPITWCMEHPKSCAALASSACVLSVFANTIGPLASKGSLGLVVQFASAAWEIPPVKEVLVLGGAALLLTQWLYWRKPAEEHGKETVKAEEFSLDIEEKSCDHTSAVILEASCPSTSRLTEIFVPEQPFEYWGRVEKTKGSSFSATGGTFEEEVLPDVTNVVKRFASGGKDYVPLWNINSLKLHYLRQDFSGVGLFQPPTTEVVCLWTAKNSWNVSL